MVGIEKSRTKREPSGETLHARKAGFPPTSQAAENYLKTIFLLQAEREIVTTSAIAERLKVSTPSVTAMVKKVAEMGLVRHTPYQGVALTEQGERVALEMIRHHRLLELFLAKVVGLSWDKVHDEAEKLEHVLSDEFEDRIDEVLGFPRSDPHGDPIPARDGTIPETEHKRLSELEQGQSAIIRRVSDRDPSVLKYLAGLDLFPGALIKLVDVGPLGDTLIISAGKNEHAFGRELSKRIKVEVCPENGLPPEELEGLAAWQSRELLGFFGCWPWSRRKVKSKPRLKVIQ